MTPGTGKFFTNSNKQPEQEGDIVAELRDWAEIIDRVNDSGTAMVTMISGAVHREAADEIERLRKAGDALANGIRTGHWDDALDAWTEVRDD